MKVVWKRSLRELFENTDSIAIEMPYNAKPLCVALQQNVPTFWYECQPSDWTAKRTMVVVGTGYSVQEAGYTYVGTVLMCEDTLVLHFYLEDGP